MILTIVPNPALDKTVVLPGFEVGHTFRAHELLTLAGGKGFNFARALRALGQASLIVAPVGGHAGQLLLELAASEGQACDPVAVRAEMRTCLTVIDPPNNYRLTEIYEQGVPLQMGEWDALVERAAGHFADATYLALCGSFPPGVPQDGLYRLTSRAREAGLPVLLDTHGPQLPGVLSLEPALLKINQFEASELIDRPLTDIKDVLDAARKIKARGAQEVVITLGELGAVGVTRTGKAFGWASPKVAALSPIGSGDSLFAGVVAGLASGQSLQEATRLGAAAGAANTLQIGAGRLERRQVETLLISVSPLLLEQ